MDKYNSLVVRHHNRLEGYLFSRLRKVVGKEGDKYRCEQIYIGKYPAIWYVYRIFDILYIMTHTLRIIRVHPWGLQIDWKHGKRLIEISSTGLFIGKWLI